MKRPWRRYCVSLSLRLHMPVTRMLTELDSADIAEYMAYDMTHDEDFKKRFDYEQQMAASAAMSDEERAAQFRRHLTGGK